jgi:magnesium-transporting ATPase (P-type)
VLCLDIGTDILPAVALGAEPSSARALARPPLGRHLVDRALLVRALLVLGLTESVIEMVAFLATLASAGWRPGASFPSGAPMLAASGAAFTSVVAGQMANAFVCRSATVSPRHLGWFSNHFLVGAVLCEAVMLAGFLYLPFLSRLLGQAPPNTLGYVVAAMAIPAVLAADAIQKQQRARSRSRR